jgi:hypothetical protein
MDTIKREKYEFKIGDIVRIIDSGGCSNGLKNNTCVVERVAMESRDRREWIVHARIMDGPHKRQVSQRCAYRYELLNETNDGWDI